MLLVRFFCLLIFYIYVDNVFLSRLKPRKNTALWAMSFPQLIFKWMMLNTQGGDMNYMFILQFIGLLNFQFIRWKLQRLVTSPAHLVVQGLGEQVTKPCQSHISTDHGTIANGPDLGGEAEPLWLPGQGIRSRCGEMHVTAVWMAACWAFWEGFISF